ncbi:MAG: hypothetical protein U9R75_06840 [Candidatus Thermoplasmatota archaeon]|nr:hypothetical protein [Candidatus Thermoplasmatota archaeon]
MRAIDVLNETLYFSKENFNDAVTVAGEGFIIQLAMRFILIPIILLIMIPFIFILIAFDDPSGTTWDLAFIGLYAVSMLLSVSVQSIALSMMIGGQVSTLDRIKKRRKIKFGDVFKYGWRNKFPLLGVFFFNFLLYFGIISLPIIMLVATLLILTEIPLFAMVLIFAGFMVFMLCLIPFQIGIFPLPFIIRNRLGTGVIDSVLEGWRFYFKHFLDLYLIGLFYMMMMVLISMIPFINIIAQIAMYPAVIISELIMVDDVLGVQRFRPRYVKSDRKFKQVSAYDQ